MDERRRTSFRRVLMSKIAIISRPDQGVVIDVSGCSDLQEAVEHLTSTLQVSSQFWQGISVDLNLGGLALNQEQLGRILTLASSVGVNPRNILAQNAETKQALATSGLQSKEAQNSTLPAVQVFQGQASISGETVVDATQTTSQTPARVHSLDLAQKTSENLDTFQCNFEDNGGEGSAIAIDTTAGRIVMLDPDADSAQESELASVSVFEEGKPAAPSKDNSTLYIRTNLRSGQAISHEGNLIIVGDVNAGAEVVAAGDITVWGALRGVAHAGIGGNANAEIRALRLDPIQIRIGNAIARSPDAPNFKAGLSSGPSAGPETARLVDGKIRITRSHFES